MNRMKLIAVAGVAWFVWAASAGHAAAQAGAGQPPLTESPIDNIVVQAAAGNLSEDIEIMREILRRTLHRSPSGAAIADNDGDGTHLFRDVTGVGRGVAVGDFDKDGLVDLY